MIDSQSLAAIARSSTYTSMFSYTLASLFRRIQISGSALEGVKPILVKQLENLSWQRRPDVLNPYNVR